MLSYEEKWHRYVWFRSEKNQPNKSRTCIKYWKHLYFVFAKAFWSLTKDATVLYTEWQREYILHSFLHWACQSLTLPLHFNSHFYRKQARLITFATKVPISLSSTFNSIWPKWNHVLNHVIIDRYSNLKKV